MKKQIELKPCPFCGSNASVAKTMVYMDEGRAIKCGKCRCRTNTVFINHPRLLPHGGGKLDESTRYTEEQAVAKAVELWNRRVTDERAD